MVFSLATTTETNGNANLLWHSVWYGQDTIWSTSIVPFTITEYIYIRLTPHSPACFPLISSTTPPSLLLSHSLSNLNDFNPYPNHTIYHVNYTYTFLWEYLVYYMFKSTLI
jgi:hypothetical protein